MNYNSRSITIKVDSERDMWQGIDRMENAYSEKLTKKKAEALELLVGEEYNSIGRHIPIEEYQELVDKFTELLSDMKELNAKYK